MSLSRPVGRLRKPVPARLPAHAAGMRIGLFGGTFNPPHEGHRMVSLTAMKRLKLDQVWWIVTPGNPLKENSGLPSLEARMDAANRLAAHPRIKITGFESEIGTRYTYDTILYLRRRCPGVKFVWLMGADNLAGFHRWQHWREIARLVPFAVIDRPGSTLKAMSGPAALRLKPFRIDERQALSLTGRKPPAWLFIHDKRSDLSSTGLRHNGHGLTPVIKTPEKAG